MEGRSYTVLIFAGVHGKLRRLQIPPCVVHLIVVLCVVGIATAATLASTYARMLFKVSDYNNLRAEREVLETRSRTLENAISRTTSQLDSLQSLAGEVALTYGFVDARWPQFPPSMLQGVMSGHLTFGPNYCASLHALNLLKSASLTSLRDAGSGHFSLDPLTDESVTPSIWPVRGRITASFGQRMDPFTGEGAFHAGVDIAAPEGTPVKAAADGILFYAGPDAAYGIDVVIDHGYGFETKYGHLSRTYVVVGQEVKRGQLIGAVGMTGRTTGPHLHYEVRIRGTPVNPVRYLLEVERPVDPNLISSNIGNLPPRLDSAVASR